MFLRGNEGQRQCPQLQLQEEEKNTYNVQIKHLFKKVTSASDLPLLTLPPLPFRLISYLLAFD